MLFCAMILWARVSVFGQMSEFLSTVIKQCRANFEAKWQVFLSISILVQKRQFCAKKKWNFGRNVDFFIKCALLLKVIIFLQNMPIFRKYDSWREGLYTLIKCQIMIKYFNFLDMLICMCKFSLKYFICWKIVILIQNIILFSDILGKCHFPSKIYITLGINSWEKLSNFLRKVLI